MDEMNEVVEACGIIYNMITADRGYEGIMKFYNEYEDIDFVTIALQKTLHVESR